MSGLTKLDSNTTNLVTKANMLIEANYKLGVVEQKLILCLASNIQPTDSDFKTYTLSIKEFHQLLGLKGSPKYSELRQITKELMQKVFEIRLGRKVAQVAWLSYVAYNESEGTIDIRFDPFLRPYLLKLKKEFTSYKLENVVKLKSSYAIRIYELLKQYERLQERTFLLADLRKILGAEEIYPAYGNFKQRVLVPAQKELKLKTDITFEIEESKEGKRVQKIKFIITSKKKKKDAKQLELFEENLEGVQHSSQYYAKAKKLALQIGVKSEALLKLWDKFGENQVIEILERIKERKDIENPVGYITAVLNTTNTTYEVAAGSEDEDVLRHLVSIFRKTKETMPDWFLKQKVLEELQQRFNLNERSANEKFLEIKGQLFDLLGVNELRFDEISPEEEEELKLLLKK
ncbi:replication initiation protein [Cytobacillus oceanisediminis]|uniref:replication initiation protein n=1 Tax=Cytobacillus oceanisediminis TaxID=665099 RepID=UPI0011A74A8E|nr:replication initiation protein [Cytobacillus oceanisediminis]